MKRGKRQRDYSVGQSDGIVLQATLKAIANKQAQVLWEGNEILCPLTAAIVPDRNSLVVGDTLSIESPSKESYRILRVVPRNTILYRGNRKSRGEKIAIAANIDLLILVVPAKYIINQAGYIEEALIAAKRAGIVAGLYVSKFDTVGEATLSLLEEKLSLYSHALEFIYSGSSLEPPSELGEAIKGRSCCFVGDRSSGKTSLIQALLADLEHKSHSCEYGGQRDHEQHIGEIRDREHSEKMKKSLEIDTSREGTRLGSQRLVSTRTSTLFVGKGGTQLIDTPGFREFALPDISREERRELFFEIEEAGSKCSFNDCTHVHEEHCHVRSMLRSGEIKSERYQAYRALCGDATEIIKQPQPDYRNTACGESFVCSVCGEPVGPEGAGTQHRNHCPHCLSSIHVDEKPGDRSSLCKGVMEPVSVWVRKGGEWAIVHRCRLCGTLHSNRVAADDNPTLLMSLAVRPLASPPFPLEKIDLMMNR